MIDRMRLEKWRAAQRTGQETFRDTSVTLERLILVDTASRATHQARRTP